METSKRTIGIDLGGTGISFIDLRSPDDVLRRFRLDTPKGKEAVLQTLKKGVSELLAGSSESVFGIGVAVAGQVDYENKSLVFSPNLPFKKEYRLGAELENFWGVPVTIENDANAAAIGEKIFGHAREMDDFSVITLGTGVGSGIFANGKLLRGFRGSAGEAGHVPLLPNGPRCGCGQKGCLEALASGTAISAAHQRRTKQKLSAKEICALAKKGDKNAVRTLAEAGEWLGTGLVALINLFNPQGIFFTGSLVNAPKCYFQPALERVRKRSFGTSAKNIRLEKSKLGVDAGIIGASALPHYAQKLWK
ncbi:MAG: ROK family protein [Nitrospinae bacterium]|nr:ROK family protein [Nitrospinota bacterium]